MSSEIREKKFIEHFWFSFHKKLADDAERWKCTTRGCKAYFKQNSIGERYDEHLDHNHEQLDVSVLRRREISNSLKRKAQENLHERPAKLLRSELVPNDLHVLTTQDVNAIRKTVYYARSKLLPKLPKSTEEAQDALDKIGIKTLTGENFLFHNDTASNIVILTCNTNLNILKNSRSIYVDGTFKCCPKFFYQMFTIHVLHNGYYLPLIYCFLPNKTSVTYGKAFSALCEYIDPQVVFADFEEAIHFAIRKTWPSVKIKGCRFHLGQSWWRKIQSVGLASEFRNKDSEIGKSLKYLFGLPYLPPSEVLKCFTDDLMAMKPIDDKVDKVFDYIFENYMMSDSRFPPEMWAECSSSLALTTNGCESFHSRFNNEFNSAHPNIFKVIDILTEIQSETQIKARSGVNTPKPTKKQELIENIIREFSSNKITTIDYIKKLCIKNLPIL
ncbi:MULE domain-containing protein [Aphis craccivora]|uniref:MULE domain-containing protein n=1 Tax=Aphis craccivora TaxID=307492 RepID=A0A6G0VQ42_APHCR|nr:MULE domain-containing protein [Aphis craccivora]